MAGSLPPAWGKSLPAITWLDFFNMSLAGAGWLVPYM